MENSNQRPCQCENASCACPDAKVEHCVCGENCNCGRGCNCAAGCDCSDAK